MAISRDISREDSFFEDVLLWNERQRLEAERLAAAKRQIEEDLWNTINAEQKELAQRIADGDYDPVTRSVTISSKWSPCPEPKPQTISDLELQDWLVTDPRLRKQYLEAFRKRQTPITKEPEPDRPVERRRAIVVE